jgi:hypothetical protein
MNSRKTKSFYQLSPLLLGLILSGCLMGENKTFFDYAEEDAEENNHSANSTVGNPVISNPNSEAPALCCNTRTAELVPASPIGCDQGMGLYPTENQSDCNQQSLNQGTPINESVKLFTLNGNRTKKIDFLFVVDNSGSMEDNQNKLANGFESFANTFFRREDLDICVSIITTDRYLGKSDSKSKSREITIPCTKTPTWSMLSPTLKNAYIDQVIREFKSKINVGTRGSSLEMPGKSLVTYLHDLDQWDESRLIENRYHRFFRRDSVANISILTDENNWFFRDPQRMEVKNDIPVVKNAAIYNSTIPLVDTRKGLKEYLDEYFTVVQPDHAPNWSVTTFLETTKSHDTLPGLAMNLNLLSSIIGRESARSDIGQSTNGYTSLYQTIAENVVQRASAFQLDHPAIEIQSVTLIHANQVRELLLNGRDYSVIMSDAISIDAGILNNTQFGDSIEIRYRHLTPSAGN